MNNTKAKRLTWILIFIFGPIYLFDLILILSAGLEWSCLMFNLTDLTTGEKRIAREAYLNIDNYVTLNCEITSFDVINDYYIVGFLPSVEYKNEEYSYIMKFIILPDAYEKATNNGASFECGEKYNITFCRGVEPPVFYLRYDQVCSIKSIDHSIEYLQTDDGICIIAEWLDSLRSLF
ncbi:hypothetical protein J6Y73_03635 [bacterium]|nr:hypothetical protein [bacterium]